MGIPAFYRWLVDKYPRTVVDVIQETPTVVNGVRVVDTTGPNPNGLEFDNLYLDMNGIIHPCFHPEDLPAPNTYEEVYKAVFKYVDHLFSLVRPRKLLYMAVDGVAPRAKMNQQRARRFRTAKDAADAAEEAEKLRTRLEPAVELENTNKLDSNVITPGTEFMASLSLALRHYIHLRLNNDPGWRGIKVILSDSNVPGEGEHKVVSYIRSQRNLPGFDPNTRHCLYGLDADLIMLALATHEVHFSILRENILMAPRNVKPSRFDKNPKITVKEGLKEPDIQDISGVTRKRFQFLNIWVLREYLEYDLRIWGTTVKMDLERLIDDFVFICLFVGNDFLPHVPSLEIFEGAIDLLMTVYRKEFNTMGGYLTNSFEVNLKRLEHFLQVVGSHESAIFRRRTQRSRSFLNTTTLNGTSGTATGDEVRLGEEGWKERYYAQKFEVKTDSECDELKRNAVTKYVEGICWVMHYYYEGVCSWQWFYPYHYAPFASDFLDLKHLDIHFTLGVPFKPFDQLMGVLPAASAHALPSFYRNLMTDSSSSIADFYPTDFQVDLNGRRFSWQGVCKLPFIEETRLLAEIEEVEHTLTDNERTRNGCALDALFVHISNPLASKILSFYRRKKDHPKLPKAKIKRKLDPKFSAGMNGYMYISDETVLSREIYSPIEDMEMITNNQSISAHFKCPAIQKHIPRPLNGVILPAKSISQRDVQRKPMFRHEASAGHRRVYPNSKPVWNSSQERDHNNGILGKRKRRKNREPGKKRVKVGQKSSSKFKKKRN